MAPPKKTTRAKRTVTRKPAIKQQPIEETAAKEQGPIEELQSMATTPDVSEAVSRIKNRVPIGQRRPLAMDTSRFDPNYEYRHVREFQNHQPNLPRYLDAGYEFVTDDVQVGDKGIMRGSQTDSRVSVASGDNNDRLFLMRIPKEFYKEDQAAKQEAINKKEEALKPSALAQGLTGELEISR